MDTKSPTDDRHVARLRPGSATRRSLVACAFFAGVLGVAIDCLGSDPPLSLKQDGFDAERRVVRSLLGKDLDTIEESSGRKAEILIGATDLDGDAANEIVARVVHGGYCGSGGCLMIVLRRDPAGTWRSIFETTAEEIAVSSQRTLGFHDLSVRDGHDQVHRLTWNGTQYSGESVPTR